MTRKNPSRRKSRTSSRKSVGRTAGPSRPPAPAGPAEKQYVVLWWGHAQGTRCEKCGRPDPNLPGFQPADPKANRYDSPDAARISAESYNAILIVGQVESIHDWYRQDADGHPMPVIITPWASPPWMKRAP